MRVVRSQLFAIEKDVAESARLVLEFFGPPDEQGDGFVFLGERLGEGSFPSSLGLVLTIDHNICKLITNNIFFHNFFKHQNLHPSHF